MKFETKVLRVEQVIDHPNADRLSIIKVEGYDYSIVSAKLDNGSHRYAAGEFVVYCQSDSIIPEYLLKQGFWNEEQGKGILAGSKGNRVKPIKLRGVTSEGILFPVLFPDYLEDDFILINGDGERKCFCLGNDVSEFLNIRKFEPEIPASMSGDVTYVGTHNTIHYDIENSKKYPGVLDATGLKIYLTEKLHGTFCGVGYIPHLENEDCFGKFIIFSKGLGAKGLVFKDTPENRERNVYVRTILENKIFEKITNLSAETKPIFVLGEIYGKGIQDLAYATEKPKFRVFDVHIGLQNSGEWVDATFKYQLLEASGFETVPVLAVVDNEAEIRPFVDGTSTLGGNIREGVVAIPNVEQRHEKLGRIILKYVSENYLNRKGEVTEYQ